MVNYKSHDGEGGREGLVLTSSERLKIMDDEQRIEEPSVRSHNASPRRAYIVCSGNGLTSDMIEPWPDYVEAQILRKWGRQRQTQRQRLHWGATEKEKNDNAYSIVPYLLVVADNGLYMKCESLKTKMKICLKLVLDAKRDW